MATPTKFCRECGAKIPTNSEFCEKCGTRLVEAEGHLAPTAARIGQFLYPRRIIRKAVAISSF